MTRGYDTFGTGGSGPVDGAVLSAGIDSLGVTLTDVGNLSDVQEFTSDVAQDVTVRASSSQLVTVSNLRPTVDTYLRRDQGTTSFGTAATMEAKANTAVVNNQRHAYIGWNLGAILGGGFVSTSSGTALLTVSHDGVGSQQLFFEVYTDTSTWDANEPPPGTLRQSSSSVSVPAGAASSVSLSIIGAAFRASEWTYLRLLGNTGVVGDTVLFTIVSSEGSTSPRLTINSVQV
jgi:hypothetical protein